MGAGLVVHAGAMVHTVLMVVIGLVVVMPEKTAFAERQLPDFRPAHDHPPQLIGKLHRPHFCARRL